jgi:hypothetical protein
VVNVVLHTKRGCSHANGFVVVADGLHVFRIGPAAVGGRIIPSVKFVLGENNFGWMAVRELNPEELGSLWLKAFCDLAFEVGRSVHVLTGGCKGRRSQVFHYIA